MVVLGQFSLLQTSTQRRNSGRRSPTEALLWDANRTTRRSRGQLQPCRTIIVLVLLERSSLKLSWDVPESRGPWIMIGAPSFFRSLVFLV